MLRLSFVHTAVCLVHYGRPKTSIDISFYQPLIDSIDISAHVLEKSLHDHAVHCRLQGKKCFGDPARHHVILSVEPEEFGMLVIHCQHVGTHQTLFQYQFSREELAHFIQINLNQAISSYALNSTAYNRSRVEDLESLRDIINRRQDDFLLSSPYPQHVHPRVLPRRTAHYDSDHTIFHGPSYFAPEPYVSPSPPPHIRAESSPARTFRRDPAIHLYDRRRSAPRLVQSSPVRPPFQYETYRTLAPVPVNTRHTTPAPPSAAPQPLALGPGPTPSSGSYPGSVSILPPSSATPPSASSSFPADESAWLHEPTPVHARAALPRPAPPTPPQASGSKDKGKGRARTPVLTEDEVLERTRLLTAARFVVENNEEACSLILEHFARDAALHLLDHNHEAVTMIVGLFGDPAEVQHGVQFNGIGSHQPTQSGSAAGPSRSAADVFYQGNDARTHSGSAASPSRSSIASGAAGDVSSQGDDARTASMNPSIRKRRHSTTSSSSSSSHSMPTLAQPHGLRRNWGRLPPSSSDSSSPMTSDMSENQKPRDSKRRRLVSASPPSPTPAPQSPLSSSAVSSSVSSDPSEDQKPGDSKRRRLMAASQPTPSPAPRPQGRRWRSRGGVPRISTGGRPPMKPATRAPPLRHERSVDIRLKVFFEKALNELTSPSASSSQRRDAETDEVIPDSEEERLELNPPERDDRGHRGRELAILHHGSGGMTAGDSASPASHPQQRNPSVIDLTLESTDDESASRASQPSRSSTPFIDLTAESTDDESARRARARRPRTPEVIDLTGDSSDDTLVNHA